MFTIGFLNESNRLHHSNVQRMFEKYGSELAAEIDESRKEVICLMFDGRKDQTLNKIVLSNHGGVEIRETVTQEHYVIVEEPMSIYRNHFVPASGRALDIAKEIIRFVTTTESDQSLCVIGADGTSVNTGCNNGVIRKVEETLGRSLQWAICQLHLNELPFRHLFQHLDGKTTGPNSYRGPIGHAIMENEEELRRKPVVKFVRVRDRLNQLPTEVIDNFTSEQKYFYEMCMAVRRGIVPNGLSARNPGKLCEARWLTKANRILRLYVSTVDPSDKLNRYSNRISYEKLHFRSISFIFYLFNLYTRLTRIIMYVYAPAWFFIKSHPRLVDVTRNVFQLIKLSAVLRQNEKHVFQRIMQINCFSAHPESILISMLTDNNRLFVRRLL